MSRPIYGSITPTPLNPEVFSGGGSGPLSATITDNVLVLIQTSGTHTAKIENDILILN